MHLAWKVSASLRFLAMLNSEPSHAIRSVSYTHLDVYKRQLVAIVISVACECAALTFNSYADSHIDPPATVIMLMQIINLSVLQTILPSVIG